MKSVNNRRQLPSASYCITTSTTALVILVTISAAAADTGSLTASSSSSQIKPGNNTVVSPPSSDVGHRVLDGGVVLRFSIKPPLYNVSTEGSTGWYPCSAEVVRSANYISGLGQPEATEVVTKWLVPEGVPSVNYSGKGDPTGHGYFVINGSSSTTLVLVHPKTSDAGKYVCLGELGDARIRTTMEIYVVTPEYYLASTGYGFLAAGLVALSLGLLCLLNRFVIRPYRVKQKTKETETVNIQQSNIEDPDQPMIVDEVQHGLEDH